MDDDTIFHCLKRYRRGSVWEPPLICGVCGLDRRGTMDVDIHTDGTLPFDLSPSRVTDPFILNHEQFEYGIDVIDGLMLEPHGFKEQSMKGITLKICCPL